MINMPFVCSPRGRYTMALSNAAECPANEVSQGRMISSIRVKEFDHMSRSLVEMLQLVDDHVHGDSATSSGVLPDLEPDQECRGFRHDRGQ